MVQIGKIEYKAEVTGADQAESKTESLTDSYAGMGEQATETAGEAGFLGGTLTDVADNTEQAAERANDADTQFTLLKGTIAGIGAGGAELLGSPGLSGIGNLFQGTVALGQLVAGASFGSLIKGTAALGALVIAADTISDIINGKAPLTAFVDSTEDFGELVLNPIGIDDNDLLEKVVGIGTFILGTVSIASFITGVPISVMITGAGASIASFLGISSVSALVSGAGARLSTFLATSYIGNLVTGAGATIATFLGGIGLTSLVVGVGSIAALIFGMASLGDLVDGDISSWNLPGKFGYAMGQGFEDAWPEISDKIEALFTSEKNPFYALGKAVANGNLGSSDVDGGMPLLPEDSDKTVGEWYADNTEEGAQGARIQSDGLMRVHAGEELVPADVTRDLEMVDNIQNLGGGSGASVTQVDSITIDLSGEFDPGSVTRRELESLADRLADIIGDKTNRRAGVR